MNGDLEYRVEVKWDGKTGAEAKLSVPEPLKVDMAKEFGGRGRYYCSDELFLTAVTGCILETFLYIAKKMRITLKEYTASAKATVEYRRDGYHITEIDFDFNITVKKGETEKADQCFQLSTEYCHIRRALDPKIKLVYNKIINEA